MQLKNLSIAVLTTVIRYPIRHKEVVSRINFCPSRPLKSFNFYRCALMYIKSESWKIVKGKVVRVKSKVFLGCLQTVHFTDFLAEMVF